MGSSTTRNSAGQTMSQLGFRSETKTSKVLWFVYGSIGKYKSALKLAKRKLSTHKRAKMKSEEMSSVLRRIRATRGGEKKK
ncbi:hypothetical protein WN944_026748 [Citrus x changshan-huyou]|uniref:60S ribosomal protein L36 n=1 Tax=Citrus x changshan-huyou TaxID=2935761 RepID=A0AAP0LKJ3_9ROSI